MTPVLVLSAMGSVNDRICGLRAGGDDYLAKPFALGELVARLEALLRRAAPRETTLRVGPLELDLLARAARRGHRALDLLPREFRLLEYMMRREGQVLTRAMLLEHVWNYRFAPQTNLVDVHIGRLRRKLDAPDETPMILSVRGVGIHAACACLKSSARRRSAGRCWSPPPLPSASWCCSDSSAGTRSMLHDDRQHRQRDRRGGEPRRARSSHRRGSKCPGSDRRTAARRSSAHQARRAVPTGRGTARRQCRGTAAQPCAGRHRAFDLAGAHRRKRA